MEFDSPDVEKDFPGLYASESGDGRSKKSKEDSDFSDTEHDRVSKKDLLMGKRKDKKDKSKDRGYAALEGESSPDEALDSKSPSKSKKSKTFIFASSKSKEKREKSRDKEKPEKDHKDDEKFKEKEKLEKDEKKDKDHKKKDKDKKEKDKKEKAKDKDKVKEKEKIKEKDKDKDKEKIKDKEKKDKKVKNPFPISQVSTEEVLELDYPVFGVSISIATDRSHCHDGIDIPLVVRDCIDYLQENGLRNEHIYKVEPIKSRLVHFKKLYNSRERQTENDVLDVNTSCSLLKLFLKELPEPVLTTDLIGDFEELASSKNEDSDKIEKLQQLIEQLPKCNQTLLSWLLLHFDSVVENEKFNKLSAQNLAMLLSPTLQMSHRLLLLILNHCKALFPEVKLVKYVPPLTSSSPKLPDTPEEIQIELKKQDSLLSQLHAEMNAGFVTKKREEQLWEVQRIITQLKRKLRSFEKKQDKSLDELDQGHETSSFKSYDRQEDTPKLDIKSQKESSLHSVELKANVQKSPAALMEKEWFVDEVSGLLMLPKSHPDYIELIRLQLENQELLNWKAELQSRITSERADILRLKQLHHQAVTRRNSVNPVTVPSVAVGNEESYLEPGEYEKIIENFVRENNLLEQKKQILAKEIFDERRECIALQVELTMQQQY